VAARPRFPGSVGEVDGGVRGSREDADTTGADEQTNDDQYDPPEDLPPEQRKHAGDHENDCENPEQKTHDRLVPEWPESKT